MRDQLRPIMKTISLTGVFVILWNCNSQSASSADTVDTSVSSSDTISLFNGRDFTGWTGIMDNWFVEDGMFVGSTMDGILEESSWITTEAKYGDFEITLWVKLLGDENRNSGVYYRGQWDEEEGQYVVGYEFDIGGWGEEDNENWWGELHDPFRRNLWVGPGREVIDRTYKPLEWNHVRIRAEGNRIQHWLNGTQMVDWKEEDPEIQTSGFIAFQMHGETRFKVYFKDIKLILLDK